MATALPLISTIFIVLSASVVGTGWYYIRKGERETHKKLMLIGSVLALIFFITYIAKSFFYGDTTFGGPSYLQIPYAVFLFFHITLATVAAVFGIITLTFAFTNRFSKHRKIGRWTAVVWMCTAPTGMIVYVVLYLLFPGGQTKPLIDLIMGAGS